MHCETSRALITSDLITIRVELTTDLLVEGPALYPGHDVLVPPLRVRVPRPARGEHVAVRGELENSS